MALSCNFAHEEGWDTGEFLAREGRNLVISGNRPANAWPWPNGHESGGRSKSLFNMCFPNEEMPKCQFLPISGRHFRRCPKSSFLLVISSHPPSTDVSRISRCRDGCWGELRAIRGMFPGNPRNDADRKIRGVAPIIRQFRVPGWVFCLPIGVAPAHGVFACVGFPRCVFFLLRRGVGDAMRSDLWWKYPKYSDSRVESFFGAPPIIYYIILRYDM